MNEMNEIEIGKTSPIEDISKAFKHINLKVVVLVLVVVIMAIYFLTGVYVVNPGEIGRAHV